MKVINKSLVVILMSLLGTAASAADSNRGGFLLGVALGSSTGDVSAVTTADQPSTASSAAEGAAFTFKIGGAIGSNTALYFLSQTGASSEDQAHALTGIGAVYYFKRSGASLYLNGGLGLGSVSYEDESISPSYGRAATVGIGLELGMGLNLEVNYLRVQTEFDEDAPNPGPVLDYDIATTQFMLGYNWF